MNIATTHDGAGAVVRLSGRLDGEAALQMADALERLMREGRRAVLLDMSGVTYLSSPGALALQQAHQDYASARGELRVVSPSREAAEALTLAELLPRLLAQPAAALSPSNRHGIWGIAEQIQAECGVLTERVWLLSRASALL